MATSTNNTNSFNLSGFVAVNANIRNFEKNSVARFPLSISRTETNGDETTRKSALVNCECWRKSEEASRFQASSVRKNGHRKTEPSTAASSSSPHPSANCPPKRKPMAKSRRKARLPRRRLRDASKPLFSKDGYGRLFFCSPAAVKPFIYSGCHRL